eukprot:11769810-Alexandrium_andersonii.AAC.1
MAAADEVLGVSSGPGGGESAVAGVTVSEALEEYKATPGRLPSDGAEQRHFEEMNGADFVRTVAKAIREGTGRELIRSFAEYRDFGKHRSTDTAHETVKSVKKAIRMKCHSDKFHHAQYPEWTEGEHKELLGMAKEVYDFASTYLDCALEDSIEDDAIKDYGCRVRAAIAVADTATNKNVPTDDDKVPLGTPSLIERARRVERYNYVPRFPLPAVKSITWDPKPKATKGGLAISNEEAADVQGVIQAAAKAEDSRNGPRAFTRKTAEYVAQKFVALEKSQCLVAGTELEDDELEAIRQKVFAQIFQVRLVRPVRISIEDAMQFMADT